MSRTLPEVLMPFQRPEWQHDGACNGIDPDLFFPTRGNSPKPAVAVCKTCTVADTCLEYALDNRIMNGVWGGHAARGRRKILAARLAADVVADVDAERAS